MTAKKTIEQFILDAHKVHDGKYDYSNSAYVTSKTKLEINCKVHGSFLQSPNCHLKGSGCPKCYDRTIIKPQDYFLEKAREVHGTYYDYSKSKYVGTTGSLCITCPQHGDFWQTPNSHLSGNGCPACGKIRTIQGISLSKEEYLTRAIERHGGRYDYSLVEFYSNAGLCKQRIKIICPEHGEIIVGAKLHLLYGCAKCYGRGLTTEEWIEKARSIHGDKYSYKNVVYKPSSGKVCITCSVHGDFYQSPAMHISGRGCSACAKSGYSTIKQGCLYILSCDGIVKVGITNHPPEQRLKQIIKKSDIPFEIVYTYTSSGDTIAKAEKEVLKMLRNISKPISERFTGSTECFRGISYTAVANIVCDVLKGLEA